MRIEIWLSQAHLPLQRKIEIQIPSHRKIVQTDGKAVLGCMLLGKFYVRSAASYLCGEVSFLETKLEKPTCNSKQSPPFRLFDFVKASG
jgi:hypothetical protein